MTDEIPKVEVANPEPLPVVVKASDTPIPVVIKSGSTTGRPLQDQSVDPSLPAKTTYQQDLTLMGQRDINLIWEKTQAIIALVVVIFTMLVSGYCAIKKIEIPALIAMAFGTVVGFYFSRTNHAAIGGVGAKPTQEEYKGR